MSRIVKFNYEGKDAIFITVDHAKRLKEEKGELDSIKLDLTHIWWTIHHKDIDWTQPCWIKKGMGMVNRMGLVA